MLAAAACTLDPLAGGDADGGGAPVAVSFEVGVKEALTKANPATTALDDASGEFVLYVAAFDKKDNSLAAASMIGREGFQDTATLKDGSASVKMTLTRSREYKIVFFAMKKEASYMPTFNDGRAWVTLATAKANDASMDAFYASLDVTAAKTTHDVTLKRPFAQLNVLVPADNVPAGQTSFRSTMTVKMPITYDLLAGKAGDAEAPVEFTENAIATVPFGKYADETKPYKWIAMNYVFVPEDGTVEVTSFQEKDGMAEAIAIGEVPVKMNGRTNLVGNLYGSGLDLAFSVLIDGGFDEDAAPNPILERPGIGCFLSGAERAYVAGTDQFVREYDGNALTFVLLDPETEEQLAISGYSDTMQANDAVTMTVRWTKGSTTLLERSSLMYVLKDEGGQVWIADKEGNGFVIKK